MRLTSSQAENAISSSCPLEWFRLSVTVVSIYVGVDCVTELCFASEYPSSDSLLAELREPPFYLVEPRAPLWNEMEVKSWMTQEPYLDFWCFVSGEVVKYDVEFELFRRVAVYSPQE